jgi:AcrR family transcriptional regulator
MTSATSHPGPDRPVQYRGQVSSVTGSPATVAGPPLDEVGITLLRAASEVLASEGPSALTVRRIAAQAGVSTMNVYSRFGGKDGVVDHLFIEGFSRLADAMNAAPHTDDPMSDLRQCGDNYRQFALANPTYYSVMFDRVVADYVPSPAALERATATLQLLADQLARAMQAGALTPADPISTAASVWATSHGLVSLEMKQMKQDDIDWAHVFQSTTDALMRGLSRGAQPAP